MECFLPRVFVVRDVAVLSAHAADDVVSVSWCDWVAALDRVHDAVYVLDVGLFDDIAQCLGVRVEFGVERGGNIDRLALVLLVSFLCSRYRGFLVSAAPAGSAMARFSEVSAIAAFSQLIAQD